MEVNYVNNEFLMNAHAAITAVTYLANQTKTLCIQCINI